jgi:hypothetical protein
LTTTTTTILQNGGAAENADCDAVLAGTPQVINPDK